MTEVSTQRVERAPQPAKDMPAVQARILLHDQSFLDPNKTTEAPELKKDTISTFADRNYSLFEEASLRERKAKEGDVAFEEKYTKWSNGVIRSFNSENNAKKMEELRPLLKIPNATVDATDIQKLYDRYFDTNSPSSGIKTFVSDIIMNFEQEGRYDIDSLMKHRDAIKWAAKMFGTDSAEMIDQLITAEIKLLADPSACYEKLNATRNTVTAPEKKLMGFIYNKEVAEAAEAVQDGERPVAKYKTRIQEALRDSNIDKIVITAGTGAGKTTLIPQYILELLGPTEKVAVTQPRRLPTEELSDRVAKELNVNLGDDVGFKHGKGSNVSEDTRLVFTVEGSLLRKLAGDPMLLEYNYVMIDEWHEAHADTYALGALLQEAQRLRKENGKPPLKIVITSATMEREKLIKHLGPNTTSFDIEGRGHKIEPKFEAKGSSAMSIADVHTRAAKATVELLNSRSSDHHVLIFMPGDHQIKDTYEELLKLKLSPDEYTIDILTGSMTREEQKKAINVKDGKRHIIISTPVAETSLTIDRVDVISSGYINFPRVDEKTGLHYLEHTLHSKKALDQQKGRGGRVCDSVWRFLGTEEEYNNLVEHHPAEILRSDLTDKVLLLKKMHHTLEDIPLMDKDKIPKENIKRATRRLQDLGAFDSQGNITPIGERMANIPLDFHYSRMLVEAEKRGCTLDAATLAVVCSQTDLSQRLDGVDRYLPHEIQSEFAIPPGSDFLARLRMFKKFQEVGKNETNPQEKERLRTVWAEKYYLRYATLQRIEEDLTELLKKMKINTAPATTDEQVLARCIYEGFKDDLLTQGKMFTSKGKDLYNYSLKSEPVTRAVIDEESYIPIDTTLFVTAGGNVRHPLFMRMNQVVDPAWLTSP